MLQAADASTSAACPKLKEEHVPALSFATCIPVCRSRIDSGLYVLAQLTPDAGAKSPLKGTVLITAQDMFFSLTPTHSALDLVNFSRKHLPDYYEVERAPAELKIAGHDFVRFDYKSPVAG